MKTTERPPGSPSPGPSPEASVLSHNAKFGLTLFFIYLALYGGFIVLSAFARDFMSRPSFGGVNVAVVYGFGLIVGAFVLAVTYMILCKPEPVALPDVTEGELADEAQKEEGSA